MFRDLLWAARSHLRHPGFSAVAIVTLGLGIGSTVAIFSVLEATLLEPLPYRDPERLVLLWNRFESTGSERVPIAIPEVPVFEERSDLFEGFAAVTRITDATLSRRGEAEHVQLGRATEDLFSLLGAGVAAGRLFRPEEGVVQPELDAGEETDVPTTPMLLSHDLWSRSFGSDSGVAGRTLRLNGWPVEVVGVLGPDFELLLPPDSGMARRVDVWIPLLFDPNQRRRQLRDQDATLTGAVIGRLGPGVSLEQAQAEMNAVAVDLREEDPFHANAGTRIDVFPMQADVVSRTRPVLLLLFGAVSLVLAIACINVVHLLLARMMDRHRELSVRAVLGAGAARLFRQTLAECVLLAVVGSALGLGLAWAGLRLLLVLRPPALQRLESVGIDGPVLAFTVGVAVLVTLVAGTATTLPALRFRSPSWLREQGSARGRRSWAAGVLMVAEISLAVVLLTGAGLLLRSLDLLREVRPGFETVSTLAFDLSLRDPGRYRGPADRNRFVRQLEDRLAALPGVEGVGLVGGLPLSGRAWTQIWGLPGQSLEQWSGNEANFRVVTDGYLPTVGTRLLAGRYLTPADDSEDRRVAIVDETLARRFDPEGRAVGERIQFPLDGRPVEAEIIGVVEPVHFESLRRAPREAIYVPYRHEATRDVSMVLRTAVPPETVVPAVRREVRALDPQLPVYGVRTLGGVVDDSISAQRFALLMTAIFAVMSLALAAVGLYGVIAYSTGRRTQEIGLRFVLGARRSDVLRQVLGQGLTFTLIGLALGLAGAAAAGTLLRSLLYGVGTLDPVTYATVVGVLAAVSLLATWLPARRASRLDPREALRWE